MDHAAEALQPDIMPSNIDAAPRKKAVDVIRADQQAILKRFYQATKKDTSDEEYVQLIQSLCDQLTVYLSVKEEVVIPALRRVCHGPVLNRQLEESVVEHLVLRNLLETLDGEGPDDVLFQAKLTVLERYFVRHVGFEAGALLPRLTYLIPEGLEELILRHKQTLASELQGSNDAKWCVEK